MPTLTSPSSDFIQFADGDAVPDTVVSALLNPVQPPERITKCALLRLESTDYHHSAGAEPSAAGRPAFGFAEEQGVDMGCLV